MRKLDLDLRLVTPLFLGGSDTRQLSNEIRAPSVRGQLRYWLRAFLGRTVTSSTELKRREDYLMGSTEVGSPVRFRMIEQPQRLKVAERMALPHREGTNNPIILQSFAENQILTLRLMMRPGLTKIPDELIAALLLWTNLGGLGKRARRGFGSLQFTALRDPDGLVANETGRQLLTAKPANTHELRQHIADLTKWIEHLTPRGSPITNNPKYPILEKGVANILVSDTAAVPALPEPDYRQAMVPFWLELLRHNKHKDDYAYGFAKGQNRRASPLHMKTARSTAGYHLILTTFWSDPSPDGQSGWQKVEALLGDCKTRWGAGSLVWGRPL